jgi:hypothetical protein
MRPFSAARGLLRSGAAAAARQAGVARAALPFAQCARSMYVKKHEQEKEVKDFTLVS